MNASRICDKLGFGNRIRNGPATRIQAQVLSDVGCHREINEDSACCINPLETALLGTKGVLAVVADGMGGHPSGEVASKIATDVISKVYYDSRYPADRALREAFAAANTAIRDIAGERDESRGMGATCTAIAFLPRSASFLHIGDTRLYLLRDGEIRQLTEDQTKVMRMVKEGLLSIEDARTHEERNVVVCALGQRPSIDDAQSGGPLTTNLGDTFVLCSDGLHDLVSDEEISEHILLHNPKNVCHDLIALAKGRGGYDNITVAVMTITSPSSNSRGTQSDAE